MLRLHFNQQAWKIEEHWLKSVKTTAPASNFRQLFQFSFLKKENDKHSSPSQVPCTKALGHDMPQTASTKVDWMIIVIYISWLLMAGFKLKQVWVRLVVN
jgi:hypothetical protein